MIARISLIAALLLSTAGCAGTAADAARVTPPPAGGLQALERQAKSLGFDLSGVSQRSTAGNSVALSGRSEFFKRRTDSLTYIANDDRYQSGGKIDVFAGSDAALVAGARRALTVLGVPANEIAQIKIQHEYGQVGEYDGATGALKAEPRKLLNRIASFRRSIGGVPVFSSYARVGLTKSGAVGLLRVHWPRIDEQTVKAAQSLQQQVRAGFTPPEVTGARPERVDAGIVHSPAAGEVMDVAAAIRIVYRPTDAMHGKKPVRLVDASGNTVPEPRVFLRPLPQPSPQVRPAKVPRN